MIDPDNIQEQRDEIQAISAIYEQEVSIQHIASSSSTEPTILQIELPIDIPENGITLNARVYQENTKEFQTIGNFTFHHLPPVTLTFILTKEYPSDVPPKFQISAQWLTKENLTLACEQLDLLCEESIGIPVLFTICNWIQYEYLQVLLLNNDNAINLHQIDENNSSDVRAIPQCIDIQDTIVSLLKFNKQQIWEKFQLGSHNCELCFEEKSGIQFELLSCCGYAICNECVSHMCKSLVQGGSFEHLKCPQCDVEFHPTFLKKYLTESEMERWERLTLKRTLESMEDVCYCPRCETVVIVDDDDHFGQCTHCNYAFCTVCRGDFHNNASCDQMAVIMKKVRQSKDAENEMKSLRLIKKQARSCPKCKIFIARTHGCNKMTCTQCGQFFCYACGIAIQGYNHFNTTGDQSTKGCKVFDDVTDDMLYYYGNLERNHDFVNENGVLDFNRFRRAEKKYCPHCGQGNYKEGRNNDIRCYHCKRHFCFLCHEKIKGTMHFVSTACTQHS